MKWTITTAPTVEPIHYGEAKLQARIDGDFDRPWIEKVAIPNVRATAEAEAGISLITRTITAIAQADDGHEGMIRLPRGPVQAVSSVKNADAATVSAAAYEVRRYGLNDFLVLKQGQKFPITIVYTAGFGATAAAIPAHLRGIMLAHFAFLYDNRGADVEPTALDRIYRKYRSFAG